MDESTHTPGKRCTKCGIVKPLDEYRIHRSTKRNPVRGARCRDCHSAYLMEYTRERREFLAGYKLERGCMDCGYRKHVAALEFDHRPGEVKLFEPSMLKSSGTWQQMLDEIAKCDVVCANCHRERTHSRPAANRGYDLKRNVHLRAPRGDFDPDQLELLPPEAI